MLQRADYGWSLDCRRGLRRRAPERPDCYREEFRAPRGVRKSPRNEPAVCGAGLWGFEDLAVSWVMGVVFTRLLAIAVLEVLSGDRGADPRPRVGKAADGV